MKAITFIICIFFCSSIFCQVGLTFHNSLIWQHRTYYTTGPSGPGQGPQYYYTYHNYYLNGDTIINNQHLKKMYTSSTAIIDPSSMTFYTYILEDSNRVYKGTPQNFTKILDYNLQVGDSFLFYLYSTKIALLSIDSVMVNGIYYDRFNFAKGIKWIKGIGDVAYGASFDNYSFFNPPPFSWMTLGSQFRCYAENDIPTYGSYCNIILEQNTDFHNENISIYPIPAENELYIKFNSDFNSYQYEIYSTLGSHLQTGKISNELTVIDIKMLPQGIYFIKFNDNSHNTIIKRFIKNE